MKWAVEPLLSFENAPGKEVTVLIGTLCGDIRTKQNQPSLRVFTIQRCLQDFLKTRKALSLEVGPLCPWGTRPEAW